MASEDLPPPTPAETPQQAPSADQQTPSVVPEHGASLPVTEGDGASGVPAVIDKSDVAPNIVHCFPPWVGTKTLPRPRLNLWLSLMMMTAEDFYKQFGKGARPGDVADSEIAFHRVDTPGTRRAQHST